MNEIIATGVEILAGGIIIPFLIWVTVSIFGLRQQTALISQELSMIRKICEKWLG